MVQRGMAAGDLDPLVKALASAEKKGESSPGQAPGGQGRAQGIAAVLFEITGAIGEYISDTKFCTAEKVKAHIFSRRQIFMFP